MTKNSEQKERLDYHGLSKFLDNLKALFAFKTDTPTKLSQLVNDVGYKTTDTVYTHPSYAAKSSGLYKVSVDNAGHVNSATEVTKTDITQLGILSETPSFNDATSIYPTLSAATAAAETSSDAIKSGVNILTTLSNIKKSFSAIIQGLKILGTNVGMIQGITSDLNEQSDYIAASSKAVHTLNSNLPIDSWPGCKLHYTRWTGTVVAGQVTLLGTALAPEGHDIVALFFSPLVNVHIAMFRQGDNVYAWSENYTGEFVYDALMLIYPANAQAQKH